ncbi:MAG: MFS transporter, partial [Bacteroidia bacterium]|nr:MFS transporter [Bacteroidia bacterium]
MLLNEYEKPTKKHFKILLLTWSGWVFDFYDLILFTFLLIPIGKELNLNNLMLSYVLGASLAATAFGGIIFGWLSDRFGRKIVLQWTILTYSIGTFLCGLSTNFTVLLIFRIITGLGVGGEWATGQTYIGETFPAKIRGRYGAYMQTGAPVGIIIASIIGGFVMTEIGWRACFFISILPAILVIFIRKQLPESDVWLERKKLISQGTIFYEKLKHESKNNFLLLLSNKYRAIFIKSLILATFDMAAYWFTYSWLPGYLHQERHFDFVKSAEWILITQAGGFLGYLTFGFIADKLGRRPAYSIYSVIM